MVVGALDVNAVAVVVVVGAAVAAVFDIDVDQAEAVIELIVLWFAVVDIVDFVQRNVAVVLDVLNVDVEASVRQVHPDFYFCN